MIRRKKKIYVGKIKIHCVSLWNKARQHRLSVNGRSVVPIVRKKGPDYQVLLPSTSNVYSHTVSRINAYRYIFINGSCTISSDRVPVRLRSVDLHAVVPKIWVKPRSRVFVAP